MAVIRPPGFTKSLYHRRVIGYRRFLLFSPVVVAVFVMLPRLLSSQFGLLDDGLTLRAVAAVSREWAAPFTMAHGGGRFFPSYFYYLFVVHALAGPHPFLFFAANCAVFAATTAGLIGLVRLMGGTPFQSWAAGIFFVLSGPAVESYYTLSKAEPPQLLWMVIALLLAAAGVPSRNRWARAALLAATTGALLLADTSKETGVVTVAIAVGWLVVGRLCLDPARDGPHLAWRRRYALASVLAAAGFIVLRAVSGGPSLSQGSYSRMYILQGVQMRGSLVDTLALLSRDLAYVAPLAALAVVLRMTRPRPQRPLLLDAAVWMCGWVAVFLPWSWVLEYYLLPFAFGAAAFCGVVAGEAIQAIKDEGRKMVRAAIAVCVGAFLILFPLCTVNVATLGAMQLAVDAANYQLVRFISALPKGSTVSVNMPSPNEYVTEIGMHVGEIEGRPDIVVDYLETGSGASRASAAGAYVATVVMRSQVMPGTRIAMNETGAADLSQALVRALGDGREPVFQSRQRVRLMMVNMHQPLCSLLRAKERLYCLWPSPFVDTRVFSYGWNVYRQ
jgi:hypothetical protein